MTGFTGWTGFECWNPVNPVHPVHCACAPYRFTTLRASASEKIRSMLHSLIPCAVLNAKHWIPYGWNAPTACVNGGFFDRICRMDRIRSALVLVNHGGHRGELHIDLQLCALCVLCVLCGFLRGVPCKWILECAGCVCKWWCFSTGFSALLDVQVVKSSI